MSLDQIESRTAKFISWVFHPLFVPLFTLVLLFQQEYYFVLILTPEAKWFIAAIVFLNTCIFPALLMLFFKWRGLISSLHMPEKEERVFPYIMMSVFYYLTYYLFSELKLPDVFFIYISGATVLIISILLINFIWKISVHMAAMGAAAGAFAGMAILYELPVMHVLVWLIAAAGFTGFARLKLKAHSPAQVYGGYLLGFAVLFASFYLF